MTTVSFPGRAYYCFWTEAGSEATPMTKAHEKMKTNNENAAGSLEEKPKNHDKTAAKKESDDPQNWSLAEEMQLIEHMMKSVESDVETSEMYSFFPQKSKEEIKAKWRSLLSSLLDSVKRKHNEIDNGLPTDKNEAPSPTKKFRIDNTGNVPMWTADELDCLQEIMKTYHHYCESHFFCFES